MQKPSVKKTKRFFKRKSSTNKSALKTVTVKPAAPRVKIDSSLLKIGEASKALGVSIDTLRRWEKAGKIESLRTPGGTRLYSLELLRKINPISTEPNPLSTEELLKKIDNQEQNISINTNFVGAGLVPALSDGQPQGIAPTVVSKFINRFLIGSAMFLVLTLLLTSWIAASYLTAPKETAQFFKHNIASGILRPFHFLAEETIAVIDPKKARELGFALDEDPPPLSDNQLAALDPNVLAVTASSPFLEVNATTQINGSLFVRDLINGLSLEATSSAGTMAFISGDTTLTVTKTAKLDQDVSTTSAPSFTSLTLSSSTNQLASGGINFTLPATTTTLIGKDTTDTLTNKSLSGSSNTFTSIPNSALSNNKVTVTAGTNLSGGGDVELGNSITLALASSPAVSGVLKLADGTAAAPSLTFTNDLDSGLYRLDADSIGLIVGGDETQGITIDASGNVGVGTITPTFQLETTGNVGIGTSLTVTSAGIFGSLQSGSLSVSGNTGIGSSLNVSSAAIFNSLSVLKSISGATLGISGNSNLATVYTSGNVGIGATSAAYNLDVWGTGRFTSGLTVGGNLGIGQSANITSALTAGSLDTSTLSVSGNSTLGTLTTVGNVGIGASVNVTSAGIFGSLGTSALSVSGNTTLNTLTSSGNVGIGQSLTVSSAAVLDSLSVTKSISGATLGISGDSNLATVYTSGNIGIGATSAAYNLDVWGTGRITGALTVGGNIGVGTSINVTSAGIFGSLGTSALSVSGNTTLNTLTTSGNTGIGSSLTVSSAAALNTLNVSGISSLTGNVGVGSSLNVAGLTYALGGLRVNGYSDLTGNVGIGNSLNVSSAALLDSLSVTKSISGATLGISGNVGIGASVNVVSAGIFGSLGTSTLSVSGNSTLSTLAVSGNTGIGSSLNVTSASILDSLSVTKSISGATLGISGNSNLATVYTSGNVGVGATSAAYNLDVWGTGRITGALTVGGNIGVGGTASFNSLVTSTGSFQGPNGSATAPAFSFTSDTDTGFYRPSANAMAFSAGGSDKLTITADGNVGIGLTNPVALLDLSSSSSSTSFQGFKLDWSPTTAITSTGDLFNIGIGSSGNVSNLFNITDSGSSVFSISETAFTTSLPANFTSPGDVSMAYDLNFTNPTASYIKSQAPLYIVSGEIFNSSDLTLQTYNSGNLLFDIGPGGYVQVGIGSSAPFNVYGQAIIGTGYVGVGITAPQNGLLVQGNVGIGTSLPLFKFQVNPTGSSTTFINSSGNLGIGSTTSNNKLDVWGNARIAGTLTVDSTSTFNGNLTLAGNLLPSTDDTFDLGSNTARWRDLYLGPDTLHIGTSTSDEYTIAYDTTNNRLGFNVNGSGPSEITFNSDGNVGIGTTGPGYKLHVSDSASIGTFTGNQVQGIRVDGDGSEGSFALLGFGNYSTYTKNLAQVGGRFTSNGSYLYFGTSNNYDTGITNSAMVIDYSGNVGIGTTGPGTMLSVSGNGVFGFGGATSITGPSNGLGISGNLGVGTTSPNNKLQVIGAGVFGSDFGQYTAATNGLLVQGNVGIGATTSNNKLDVWGNARITGTLTVDSTLTNSSVFRAANGSAAAPAYSFTNLTDAGLWTNGDGLLLTTGGTNTSGITVTGAGNIGIGITNPAGALQVNGAVGIGYSSLPLSSFPTNGLAVSGNVGIGTTSPGALLHLSGANQTTADYGIKFGTDVTLYRSAASTLKTDGNFNAGGILLQPGSGRVYGANIVKGNIGEDLALTSEYGSITLGTGSYGGTNYNIVLSPAGGVGIGTSQPQAKLSIQGNVGIGYTGVNQAIPVNGLAISGNIGIGTTTANNALSVAGAINIGNALGITAPTNGALISGNVGIGGTSAGYNLDVWGTGRITNNLNVGGNVTGVGGLFGYSYGTGLASGANLAVSGNVGVGTTTTNSNLSVSGSAHIGSLRQGISAPTDGLFVDGNVGIGATTSSNKLDVWGNTRLAGTTTIDSTLTALNGLIGYSGVTAPTSGLAISGNLGVGTTSPLGQLHVVGQCVTGDTRLRRRKRRKDGTWSDEYEDVEIKDIKEGDQILSLNEKTDEFEPHTVKALKEMGKQEVFMLVTQYGKMIETTGEHPYLTITHLEGVKAHLPGASQQKSSVFEVDQSPKIETLTADSIIALANKEQAFTLKVNKEFKKTMSKIYQGKTKLFGPESFAYGVVELIRKADVAVSRLEIDTDYPGSANGIRIAAIIRRFYPQIDIHFKSVGRHSPAHLAAYLTQTGRKIQQTNKKETLANLKLKGFLASELLHQEFTRIRSPHGLLNISKYSTKWEKVKYLKPGDIIATIDGWEKISAKYSTGRKQTFDIEVEGTHNFVGNDIVAHNTAIFSGNVGIGVTSPTTFNLQVAGSIGPQANDQYDLGSDAYRFRDIYLGPGSIHLGTSTSDEYVMAYDTTNNRLGFNVNGSGPAELTMDSSGNLGIGTTGPGYKLDIRDTATGGGSHDVLRVAQEGAAVAGNSANILFDASSTNNAFNAAQGRIRGIDAGDHGLDLAFDLHENTQSSNIYERMRLTAGGNLGIGDPSPDYMLELYDATNTPTFGLSDDDIAHGVTTVANTDTFFHLSSISTTDGGAYLQGIADNVVGATALQLRGIQASDPTDSVPAIKLIGAKASGTGVQDLGAAETIFAIANNDDANALTVLGNGNLGIGTATPGSTLSVIGNVGIGTSAAGAALQVNGGGLFGWGTASTSLSSGAIAAFNGNVGIGTTSPGKALEVVGDISIQNNTFLFGKNTAGAVTNLIGTDANNLTKISTSHHAYFVNYLGVNATFTSQPASVLSVNGNLSLGADYYTVAAPTNGAIIQGNVGIGFTSPAATLDIIGTSLLRGTGGTYGLAVTNAGLVGIGLTNPTYQLQTTGNVGIGASLTTTGLTLASGGLRVNGFSDLTGNIGIGGTANFNSLVYSTGSFLGPNGSATAPAYSFTSSTSTGLWSPSANALSLTTNGSGTSGITVTAAGFVGIGTTAPASLNSRAQVLDITGPSGTGVGLPGIVLRSLDTSFPGNWEMYLNAPAGGQNAFNIAYGTTSMFHIRQSGNIGIGTAAPLARLAVTGNVGIGISFGTKAAPVDGLAIQGNVGIGTSTANSLLSVSGGAHIGSVRQGISAPTDGLIVDGNVGIGATTSSNKLDVWGNARVTGTLTLDGTFTSNSTITPGGQLLAIDGSKSIPSYSFASTGNEDNGMYLPSANAISFSTAGSDRLTITAGGNVGIGTTAPLTKLDFGTSAINNGQIINLYTSGTSRMGLGQSSFSADMLIYSPSNEGIVRFGTIDTADGTTWTEKAYLNTSGTLQLDGNLNVDGTGASYLLGNVGIGITAPAAGLTVSTNALIGYSNGIRGPSSGLAVSGNVGIGTTSPNNKLQVIGAGVFGGDFGQYSAAANGLLIQGNVGIGATTSSNKLDVWGNARIAGTLTVDSTLTNSSVFRAANGSASAPAYSFTNLTNAGLWTNGDALLLTTGGSNTSGITVTGAGNVGIGTTAPHTLLELATGGVISSGDGTNFGSIKLFDTNRGRMDFNSDYTGGAAIDGGFLFQIAGINKVRIDTNGNVGIGTTSPLSLLSVAGNAHIGSVRQGISAPTDGLFVDGNVGIGATTSSNKLDVWGNARIAGTLTVDSTLTNSSVFRAANGSASSPSYSFTNLTNAGLWTNGDGLLLTTGGSNTSGITVTGAGLVGIGNTNPQYSLDLSKNSDDNPPARYIRFGTNNNANNEGGGIIWKPNSPGYTKISAKIVGIGEGNYFRQGLAFFTGNDSDETTNAVERLRISATGNVGIGFTSPDRITQISSDIDLTGSVASLLGAGGSQLGITGGSATGLQKKLTLGVDTTNNYGIIQAGNTDGTAYNLALQPGGGNVGIGTTSPGALLEISGGSIIQTRAGNPDYIAQRSRGSVAAPTIVAADDFLWGITARGFDGNTYRSAAVIQMSVDGTPGASDMPGRIEFYTVPDGSASTAERMRITSAGNVGIGTTSPNSLLSVAGGAHIGSVRQGISAPTDGLFVDGNVGIGATTSSNKLDVWGNARITGNLTVDGSLTSTASQFLAANGTAALPSYSFTNSPSTGLWSPSLNALSLTTNGSGTSGITVTAGGNVGIGTTAPLAKLQVAGRGMIGGNINVGPTADGLDVITSSGTIGFQVWDDNVLTKPRFIVERSGNVGISTSAPSSLFEVYGGQLKVRNTDGRFVQTGSTGFGLTAQTNDNSIQSQLSLTNTQISAIDNGSSLLFNLGYGGSSSVVGTAVAGSKIISASEQAWSSASSTQDAYMSFQTSLNGTLTEYMRINSNGNIGIGTSSPLSKLSVAGGAHIGSIRQGISAPTDGLFVDGNVGIGATTSSNKLDVWGDSRISGTLTADGITSLANTLTALPSTGFVGIGTTSPSVALSFGTQFESMAGTSNALRLYDDGATNTSTSNNSYGFGVKDGNQISYTAGTGGAHRFYTANTERLVVTSTGNVGIGFTSPDRKFQVGTDIDITGTAASILGANGAQFSITGLGAGTTHKKLTLGVDTTDNYGIIQAGNTDGTAYNLNLNPGGGNVGIGTTSPGQILAAYTSSGNAYLEIGRATQSQGSVGTYIKGGAGGKNWSLYQPGSSDDLRFHDGTTDRFTFQNGGNLGIGTASPVAQLDVRNTNTSTGLHTYIGSSAGQFSILDNGNVGIGTTSPSDILDIVSEVYPAKHLRLGGYNAEGPTSNFAIDFYRSRGSYGSPAGLVNNYILGEINSYGYSGSEYVQSAQIRLQTEGTIAANRIPGAITFSTHPDSTSALAERMRIDSAGNIGIGFTSPAATLDVIGTTLLRGTAGTYGLAVGSNGNVGIGTTAPLQKLEVNGGLLVSGTDPVTGAALIINRTAGTPFMYFQSSGTTRGAIGQGNTIITGGSSTGLGMYSSDTLVFGSNGSTARMLIDNNGNVGIGTTSPNSKLTVVGNALIGNTWTGLSAPTSGLLVEGNVGIGSTTSSNKLDVWGNARIAGTLTVDSTLTNTSVFRAANGSATTPAYSFTNLTNAGLWTNGDGLLLTTGGSNTSGITVTGAGNVGIGLTSPRAKLNISLTGVGAGQNDVMELHTDAYATNEEHLIKWTSSSVGEVNVGRFGINFDGTRSNFVFRDLYGGSGEVMRIAGTGNVGIGTTGPTQKLDVWGKIETGTNASNDNGIRFYYDRDDYPGIYGNIFHGGNSSGLQILSQTITDQPASGNIRFYNSNDSTGATEKMRISSTGGFSFGNSYVATDPGAGNMIISGNVGIGTTGPANKLEVSGGNLLISNAASSLHLQIQDSTNDATYKFINNNDSLTIRDNGNNDLLIFNGANNYITAYNKLGIGVDPTNVLDVEGSAVIGATYAGSTTAPTNGLIIEGNVGIGTSQPQAKLSIQGNVGIGYTGVNQAIPVNGLAVAGNVGIGRTTASYALDVNGTIRATGLITPYQHTITVAKSGGDYTTITAALNAISDNSATNRYLIKVMPGIYTEQVTMKSYVDLEGSGWDATRITNSSSPTVTTAANSSITHFEISSSYSSGGGGGSFLSSTANNVYIAFNKFSLNTGADVVYSGVSLGGTDTIFENNKIVDSDSVAARLDYAVFIMGNNVTLRNNTIVAVGNLQNTTGITDNGVYTGVVLINNYVKTNRNALNLTQSGSSFTSYNNYFESVQGGVYGINITAGATLNSFNDKYTSISNSGTFNKKDYWVDPLSSATQAVLPLGARAMSGLNGSGTFLGINAASGYTGDFANFAVNNTTKLRIDNNGNIGIGSTMPTASLYINGNAMIGYSSGAPSSLSNGLAVSGSIGIGTTNPEVELHIESALAQIQLRNTNTANHAYIDIEDGSSSNDDLLIGIDSDTGGNLLNSSIGNAGIINRRDANALQFGTNSIARMTIDSSGNIGIGTASPASKLQLIGTSTSTAVNLLTQGNGATAVQGLAVLDNGNVGIGTTNPTVALQINRNQSGLSTLGSSKMLLLGNTSGSATERVEIGFGYFGGQPVIIGHQVTNSSGNTYGNFYVATKNPADDVTAERLTITAAGNVGIGFSAADRPLQVASTINIDSSIASLMGVGGTQFNISGATSNAAKKLVLGLDTTGNYGVIQAGNTDGTAYNLALQPGGGNVGIGFTSPAATLDVIGTSLLRGTGGTYGLAVTNNGYVGIGITSPSYKLSISDGTDQIGVYPDGTNAQMKWTDGDLYLMSDEGDSNADSIVFIRGKANGVGKLYIEGPDDNGDRLSLVGENTYSEIQSLNNELRITTGANNADILLTPNGTGDVLVTAGNLGIGFTSPAATLDVIGTSMLRGSLGKYGLTVTNAGRVGIGTTAPNTLLQIGDGNGTQEMRIYGASGRYMRLFTDGDGNIDVPVGQLLIATHDNDISLSSGNNIRIAAAAGKSTQFTGNVGIGNTNPQGLFEVGNAATPALYIASPTGNVGIGTTGPGTLLHIGGTNQTTAAYGIQFGTDTNLYRVDANALKTDDEFRAARLYLASAGDISGADAVYIKPESIDNGVLYLQSGINAANSKDGIRIQTKNASDSLVDRLTFQAGTNTANIAFQNSNVGIGFTSPAAKLDVHGTTLLRGSLGVNGLAVTNAGMVGIGTTAPATKLQVVGDGDVAGSFTNGSLGIGTADPASNLPNGFFYSSSGSVAGRMLKVTSSNDAGIAIRPGLGSGDGWMGLDLWSVGGSGEVYIDSRLSNSDTQGMHFRTKTNGTPVEAMFIQASGNIGIGTILPTAAFQVNSTGSNPFVVQSGGNVGIGTTSPVYALDVQANVAGDWASIIRNLNATGLGLQTNIAGGANTDRVFGARANSVDVFTITGAGNVGIGAGVTVPAAKLDVRVDDASTNGVTVALVLNHTTTGTAANGIGTSLQFQTERSDGALASVGRIDGVMTDVGAPTEDGALDFYTVLNGSWTRAVRIDANGNVGIGTTTVDHKLDVFDATSNAIIHAKTSAVSGNAAGLFGQTPDSNFILYAYDDSYSVVPAYTGKTVLQTESGNLVLAPYQNDIEFYVGQRETANMILKSGGNLGIGTTGPSEKLQLIMGSDTSGLRIVDSNSRYGAFRKRTGTNDFALSVKGSGSEADIFTIGEDTGITTFGQANVLFTGGNVGIGFTSPAATLDVHGTTLLRGTLGVTGLAVTNAGMVGIGTTAPVSQLELSSASTSTAFQGLKLSWLPTASTTLAGDLVNIGIGSSGNAANLLNITDSGSSIFSISETALTTSLPVNFTSPGDVAIAYDINMTNPTASYIKSQAPLYLTAGEVFNSSDLTLQTFNSGNINFDPGPGGLVRVGIGSTAPFELNGQMIIGKDYVGIGRTAPQNGMIIQGNVGIGTSSPTAPLEVRATGTGTIAKFTSNNTTGCTLADGGTISCSSDINFKKNIDSINYGLDTIVNLHPVVYNWKTEKEGTSKSLGFIAQEVESVIPKLVTTDENGYKQLNTIGLVPVLTKAIQEQQSQLSAISLQLSNLNISEDGTLNVPSLKTDSIVLDPSLTLTANTLSTMEDTLNTKIASLEERIAALEERRAILESPLQATESASIATPSAEIATDSAQIATDSAQSTSGESEPTPEVSDGLDLTPPDILYATGSAQLANLTVHSEATFSGQLTAYDLDIQNSLKALGKTTLGDTTIAGTVTIDGTLSIDNGSEINVMGTLYLQKSYLAGALDILNGAFVFNPDGTLEVSGTVLASEIAVKAGTTAGVGTITAGQIDIIIENEYVDENSIILITPRTPLAQTLAVTAKTAGGFLVELAQSESVDITFDYLIVGVK